MGTRFDNLCDYELAGDDTYKQAQDYAFEIGANELTMRIAKLRRDAAAVLAEHAALYPALWRIGHEAWSWSGVPDPEYHAAERERLLALLGEP